MAYLELTMIDVKEVLRRWQAGQSARQIGRDTGTNRKTVSRYIGWAERLGVKRDEELSDEVVQAVAQCVQDRPDPDRSQEWEEVARHRQQIEAWLAADRPLRLTKIHVLLQREGLEASYWTLRRYVMRELGWRKKRPTILLEDPPAGQEAQVDFGKMGYVIDAETGRRRRLWALIVTLSYSRLSFVWPTFRQTTEAICEGLDRAWQFFGAMPKTIIPDNPKAIVADPDALNARLCDSFTDYVQARGLFVDPARIRSPKDKPRVENQVPYVRESWFAGEQFRDLDDARRSAEHWSREIAGRRVHGTTRRVPLEAFESEEKSTMLPPPTERFDVPLWTDAKVHPDHHIQVARALYSVPTRYLHRKVRARADSRTVRIYAGTELIKVHPRKPPGGRSTDVNDYPADQAVYALRSVDAVLDKARQRGTHIGLFAERILGGPLPWARMRQAYSLLRLCDKYGDGRVEALCQSSLAFDVVDVSRLKRMLKSATRPPAPDSGSGTVTQLTLPRFARDRSHFETRPRSTEEEGS
jgi:transposase